MKLIEITQFPEEQWEVIYVDENNNVIEESAVRQLKRDRKTNKIKKKYRCTSGRKKGKIVSSLSSCSKRPDPKRRRIGKRVMRSKKYAIQRKSKVTKRKSISKILAKMNARMMGKTTTSGPSKNSKH